MKFQEFAALRHSALLDSVSQKAEVTDAHKTIGQDVEPRIYLTNDAPVLYSTHFHFQEEQLGLCLLASEFTFH